MSETLELLIGKTFNGYSSDQTWAYFLTPTGFEKPLREAPVRLVARRSEGQSTRVIYTPLRGFTLRLVNIHTSFGKPTKVIRVDLQINNKAEEIEINTPSGLFHGRAKVIAVDGKKDSEVKGRISIKIISPPLEGPKKKKKVNLIT
ncbi:hypothetical protein DRN93_02925 [archaeon]|nr:MAG: hypothetical protein DRN93_02925 [archaeon]